MPVYAVDGFEPELPSLDRHFIAPDADVIGKVTIAEDVGIWFGAVLRGDIERISIGARTNIQDLTLVHTDSTHPTIVGDNVTIGHSAIIHGCTIRPNTLIGMGAVLLTGAKIGANCLVAAHALVAENKVIPDGSLVMGVPGRVVRQLAPEEVAAIAASAERYVRRWRGYANGGFRKIRD